MRKKNCMAKKMEFPVTEEKNSLEKKKNNSNKGKKWENLFN